MAKAKKLANDKNNNNNNNTSMVNRNHARQQQLRQQQQQQQEKLKPSKLDYAIAAYLRGKLPEKEASFLGMQRVNYFTGSKAVDLMMESKWFYQPEPLDDVTKVDNRNAIFKTRNDVVNFLNDLLLKKFYHRASKIIKVDGAKKRFKLDMHDVQVFEDSKSPYIWLYEPTSLKAWLLCFGVIFAVIAICLFPLWPPMIRTWIYYLCIAGLVVLTSILSLIVLRHIVYVGLWALTFGKLHFWIFPNLTEDVGFFESFWPLYMIEPGDGLGGPEQAGGGDGGGGGGGNECLNSGDGGHSHQD